MFRVIIAGGGIGGLCLAQGLKQAGVDVTVYERDREPDARLQGYRLNIEPVGCQALRHCLPAELWDQLVATSGDPGPGMGVFNDSLRLLMLENSSSEDTHAVSRVTLRKLLLTGLGDIVRFGKEFDRYEQADGTVTARFTDGTSATGEVLVGADGARSRVRAQLLPHARRIDTGGVGVGGKLSLTPETEAWLPAGITTRKNLILPPRDFLFTSVFRRRQGGGEESDYVMWAYVAHRDTYPAQIAGGEALRDHVERQMVAWHPSLRRMVHETGPETVQPFEFSAGARVTAWPSTSVTVLGDAIHSMPPVGGLGGNAALRDASALCQALTAVHGGAALLPALHSYEAEMIKTGFAASKEAQLYTKLAILRSRAIRGTARSFFRLCGAVPPLRRAIFES